MDEDGRTMVETTPLKPGDRLEAAYASSLWGDALVAFNVLSADEQVCVDSSLNDLEWCPWPADALAVRDAGVLAVKRCGYWIVYDRDDAERSLDVWAILR